MSALNSKADKSVSEQLQTCGCRVLELTKNDRRFLLIGWLTGARLVSHYQLMLLIAFHMDDMAATGVLSCWDPRRKQLLH